MKDAELERIAHDHEGLEKQPGQNYELWLQWFHANVMPQTYLEIGTETGKSLQCANYLCKAIAIDPNPHIVFGHSAFVRLYKNTSDTFFALHDPVKLLGGTIDLAFIDGLHEYEQVLRDFQNVEKYCARNSIVLFHDIHPAVADTARREQKSIYYAGDTWKAFVAIHKYRPDLQMFTIPTYPTGLGVVTNLNPSSTTLENKYETIVEEFRNELFEDHEMVNRVSNDYDVVRSILGLKRHY